MAEVLEEFPGVRSHGSPRKYNLYMDGQVWRINWREETGCKSAESAVSSFHSSARFAGLRMRTQLDGDDHIIVQAYEREE